MFHRIPEGRRGPARQDFVPDMRADDSERTLGVENTVQPVVARDVEGVRKTQGPAAASPEAAAARSDATRQCRPRLPGQPRRFLR